MELEELAELKCQPSLDPKSGAGAETPIPCGIPEPPYCMFDLTNRLQGEIGNGPKIR